MNDREEQLAELITARALNPDLEGPDWVTSSEWEKIGQLARVVRDLRVSAQAAPPLAQDRTAVMLGLVPDPHVRVDRAALKRARQRAGLTAGALTALLNDRGWEVAASDVLRWETQSADDLFPALLEAIARELDTQVGQFTSTVEVEGSPQEQLFSGAAFQALTARLAAVLAVPVEMAEARLRSASIATAYRGDHPDQQQAMATLEAFVSVIEFRHER